MTKQEAIKHQEKWVCFFKEAEVHLDGKIFKFRHLRVEHARMELAQDYIDKLNDRLDFVNPRHLHLKLGAQVSVIWVSGEAISQKEATDNDGTLRIAATGCVDASGVDCLNLACNVFDHRIEHGPLWCIPENLLTIITYADRYRYNYKPATK